MFRGGGGGGGGGGIQFKESLFDIDVNLPYDFQLI